MSKAPGDRRARQAAKAARDAEALDCLAALLRENPRLAGEDLIAAFYDTVGMSGRVTDSPAGDPRYAVTLRGHYHDATGKQLCGCPSPLTYAPAPGWDPDLHDGQPG